MKIYSVNTIQPKSYARPTLKKVNEKQSQISDNNQLVFKGDKGALKGMAAGAVIGLGAAAITIATGGLAALVAAGGASAVAAGATGIGAQIGGIIGGITSDD